MMIFAVPSQNTPHATSPKIISGWILGLTILSHLTLLALLYGQTWNFDYVFFDDTEYIFETEPVLNGLSLEGLKWAFTSFSMHNWHPLTWISYMLDASLHGADAGWTHLHNVAIHGLNGLLVLWLLLRLSGSLWKAYFLSIVFLVHPLHVESVAWIAERKDVLCSFFFVGGLILYDSYRTRPDGWRYFWVLLSSALALMAKPMAVTFPVVLLIFDLFIYRDKFQVEQQAKPFLKLIFSRALIEKLPMLAMSLAAGIATILAQDTAVVKLELYPFGSRLVMAASAYITYLKQFVYPVDLIVYYPLPDALPLSKLALPGFLLLAMILTAAVLSRKFPLVPAGLWFYLITLLPVIGLMQVGSQAHADRYMYIPSIGLLIACLYLLPEAGQRYHQLVRVVSIIFVIFLSTICFWQVSYWKDRHTLFSRALDKGNNNYMAHIQLASHYWSQQSLDESREHLLQAMSFRPELPDAYWAMANIALAELEYQAAESLYSAAADRGMNSAELQNNLGVALAEQGRLEEAIKAFELALSMDPNSNKAIKNIKSYSQTKNEATDT